MGEGFSETRNLSRVEKVKKRRKSLFLDNVSSLSKGPEVEGSMAFG